MLCHVKFKVLREGKIKRVAEAVVLLLQSNSISRSDKLAGAEPVYEVVLLQVATAEGNVSGHLQQLPHGESRGLALNTAQPNLVCHTHKQRERVREKGAVRAYSSWPVLSQKALHVPSGHQLQQDETWQDVQTDTDAAHNVLMAELAAKTNRKQTNS